MCNKYRAEIGVRVKVFGPVVAEEAFDDFGCPHTLEHLIFLGSERYPFKGLRCAAGEVVNFLKRFIQRMWLRFLASKLSRSLKSCPGVLDVLANRCLAQGTNAWTATDASTTCEYGYGWDSEHRSSF